jgi:hypothetical protein
MRMKYWGLLVAKLLVAGAGLYAVWLGLHSSYPSPEHVTRWGHEMFLHDLPWTTIMFLYNLLCNGVLFLIILDQRYRCRTCARRLRMPITTGRYGHTLLFGPPRTEYICLYGHGTLKVPELHITGREMDNWEPHDQDIWKELESASAKDKE